MQEKQVVSSEQPRGKIRSFFAKRKKKMIFAVLFALPEVVLLPFLIHSPGEYILIPLMLLISYAVISLLSILLKPLRSGAELYGKKYVLNVFLILGVYYFFISGWIRFIERRPYEALVYIAVYFIEVLIIFYFSSKEKFIYNVSKFLSIQIICTSIYVILIYVITSSTVDEMVTITFWIKFFFMGGAVIVTFPFSLCAFLLCPIFAYLLGLKQGKSKPVAEIGTLSLFVIVLFNMLAPDVVMYSSDYIPLYGKMVFNLLHNFPHLFNSSYSIPFN